jgi:RNA polymerase sigma factor (sigma-70 family)
MVASAPPSVSGGPVDGSAGSAPYPVEMRELTVDPNADVERCYREHAEKIWRALLLYTGDREVASDAVAEAFAQALRRGDQVRDVERWVWRASFKIARGELARRRRDAGTFADVPVELPEDTVDLMRALAGLSPKQRGAAVLRLYAGYSAKETARILGSTAGAVGMHLDRARRRLRDELGVGDDG